MFILAGKSFRKRKGHLKVGLDEKEEIPVIKEDGDSKGRF